jgi:hypothetical protein
MPRLPSPPKYHPFAGGRYDVAPNLRPLSTDYGNGAVDALAFQLDDEFPRYRENKLACRKERPGKYHCSSELPAAAAAAVARLIASRLALEHPALFEYRCPADGGSTLACALTGETLHFDRNMMLDAVQRQDPRTEDRGPGTEDRGPGTGRPGTEAYTDALDALACQVQEDLAVTCAAPERGDWLAAYHVCAPSYWAPEEKLGQTFIAIHAPVPGFERINPAAPALVDAMVRKGPWVRFVWGVTGDDRLNHHTEPPEGTAPSLWRSPAFLPERDPPFYLRVERQVLLGLPEVGASLFLIRPYVMRPDEIRADPRLGGSLRSALLSMSPASREYKGVDGCVETLAEWLAPRGTA